LALALLALCLGFPVQLAAEDPPATRDPRAYFFAQTFGDLPEELEEARESGKFGLMLFFEQEGCPYCERMMKTILNQPGVQDWYRERFVSIAVDINGDIELRDVDGISLPSKVFAEHRRVKTTPTISFIDLTGAEVYRRVTMVSGVDEFLRMGEYVARGHYTDTAWKDYAAQADEARAPATVPLAHDFSELRATAEAGGLKLLLAVTREGCPYCAQLRREILAPMILGGEYSGRVLIREMMMEPDTPAVDFAGHDTTTSAMAARYDLSITPTVILLSPAGRLLAPPIVGINNSEMYGHYLDQAIATAASAASPETQAAQE
jgi:thioredoxin-related protein